MFGSRACDLGVPWAPSPMRGPTRDEPTDPRSRGFEQPTSPSSRRHLKAGWTRPPLVGSVMYRPMPTPPSTSPLPEIFCPAVFFPVPLARNSQPARRSARTRRKKRPPPPSRVHCPTCLPRPWATGPTDGEPLTPENSRFGLESLDHAGPLRVDRPMRFAGPPTSIKCPRTGAPARRRLAFFARGTGNPRILFNPVPSIFSRRTTAVVSTLPLFGSTLCSLFPDLLVTRLLSPSPIPVSVDVVAPPSLIPSSRVWLWLFSLPVSRALFPSCVFQPSPGGIPRCII